MGCYVCVDQGNVALVEQWGKFMRLAYPGCHILNPFCGETVRGYVSQRIQQVDVVCETKTKDNVFVNVMVSVQYKVIHGSEFAAAYTLHNTVQQLTAYIYDVVRAIVPTYELDHVFAAKDEMAVTVRETLKKAMGEFGYEIVDALVTEIDPDQKVKNAMNEINAAQRMREATKDKAEADKLLVVKQAEADSESKYLQGLGIARQRQAIMKGLQESVVSFSGQIPGTSARSVMDMMMLTQYNDMIKDVGAQPRSNTIFIPDTMDDIGKLRSGVMQGNLSTARMLR